MKLTDYLKTSKKTHLIFDFDETMLQLVLPWEDVLKNIKKEIVPLDKKTYEDYGQGKISYSSLQNKYVKRFGKKILDVFNKNTKEFEKVKLKGVNLNHELMDFIKNLSGYEMFIWSSNTRSTIERLLKNYGIYKKFKKIVCREDVEFVKPEIDGFDLFHNKKTPKEKYLFIGDSMNDKLAAEKIGIDFYFVDFFKKK